VIGKARFRWLLPAAVAAGIMALAALWYATSRSSGENPTSVRVDYSEGVAGSVSRINPLFASFNQVDTDLSALIFSGLTRLGPDGSVQPDLAESWDISDDGLDYRFHLRQHVSWHDGQPFVADDVIFTYQAIQDANFHGDSDLEELFRTISVTKVDEETVNLHLTQPFTPLLARLTVGILPSHILGGLDADGLFSGPFNEQPVGTGPYRLSGLQPDRVELEANSDYYLGVSAIKRLEIHLYPDEAQLLTALKQNEVQNAFFRTTLSSDGYATLAANSDWKVWQPSSTTSTVLFFNNASAPLNDPKVRQALVYGINRFGIIYNICEGHAVQADSPIPVGTWAYSPVLDRYKFDSDQASAMLDEAGWVRGDNGVRAKDGQEFTLKIVTNDDDLRKRVAETIAQNWSDIGVPTTVETQGATELLRDTLTPRQFQVAIYGFDGGPDPDLYPAYHSSQAGPGGNNLSGFSNSQADLLLQRGRQTSDPDARLTIYRQFQEVFAQEMPVLPLYMRTYTYVTNKHLDGVGQFVLFNSGSRFVNVSQWRLNGG
jgi:peptide/nickel transport system substrate-binding protein